MSYKYIFFDLDGTLTNSKEGIFKSLEYAFDKMGMEKPSESVLSKFIGPPLTVSFHDIMGFDDKQTETAIKKYRERYTVKGLYENYPYPGMEELLKKVRDSGKKLAVATSKPEFMSVKVIEHFGLSKYFETISGSADESEDKADVIRKAFLRLNIQNSEKETVLMIGDRKHDVLGAHQCGIKCCGVKFGFSEKGEFEKCGADYVVDTVRDLEEFLLSV